MTEQAAESRNNPENGPVNGAESTEQTRDSNRDALALVLDGDSRKDLKDERDQRDSPPPEHSPKQAETSGEKETQKENKKTAEEPPVSLHDQLFGNKKPASQTTKEEDGAKKPEKETNAAPNQEGDDSGEWTEGFVFRVGRTTYEIGKNISLEAAREIQRGWRAKSEAQKTAAELNRLKSELEKTRQSRADQTDLTDSHNKPLPQKAGEASGPAQVATGATTDASPAAPSPDENKLLANLKSKFEEEFGEETGAAITQNIQTLVEQTAQRMTAQLKTENAKLTAEIERIKPTVERHTAVLSETEQKHMETQALDILESYLDDRPDLRELGADNRLLLECFRQAQKDLSEAGVPAEEISSSAGRMACLARAEVTIAQRFIKGVAERNKAQNQAGRMEQSSARRSATTPNGAAPSRGGFVGSRDANAEALNLVKGQR